MTSVKHSFITWSVFARWFLTELCLYISFSLSLSLLFCLTFCLFASPTTVYWSPCLSAILSNYISVSLSFCLSVSFSFILLSFCPSISTSLFLSSVLSAKLCSPSPSLSLLLSHPLSLSLSLFLSYSLGLNVIERTAGGFDIKLIYPNHRDNITPRVITDVHNNVLY